MDQELLREFYRDNPGKPGECQEVLIEGGVLSGEGSSISAGIARGSQPPDTVAATQLGVIPSSAADLGDHLAEARHWNVALPV